MFTVLPAAARDCLEEFMTTTSHRYQSEFARRYFSPGRLLNSSGSPSTARTSA